MKLRNNGRNAHVSVLGLAVLLLAEAGAGQCSAGGGEGVPVGTGDPSIGIPGLGDQTRRPARTGLGNPRPTAPTTQWERWWEFNKDAFLRLKESVYTTSPVTGVRLPRSSDAREASMRLFRPNGMDRGRSATTLRRLLEDAKTKRDSVANSLLAIARVRADMDVLRLLRSFLSSSDGKKAEYAAIALGVSRLQEALPSLIDLATCSKQGHKLCKREHVPFRVRAFACYGIAILASRASEHAVKRRAFSVAKQLLESRNRYDVRVAAIHVLRLLQPDEQRYDGQVLQHEALSTLAEFIDDRKQPPQVRAHALTALGRLAGRRRGSRYQKRVIARLRDRRESPWVQQSAALALGHMLVPTDEACRELRKYQVSGKDLQARNFAAISLGRIGGAENRTLLLKRLKKKSIPDLHKPWFALGLAILDRTAREEGRAKRIDLTVGDAIHIAMRGARNPSNVAGFATALGLMSYKDAGRDVLRRLRRYEDREEAAGHLAVALAMMRFTEAKEDLTRIVKDAVRRPRLMAQGAIALALLGDKDISRTLVQSLSKRKSSAVHAALVQALGYIGDRRSIGPLLDMLESDKLTAVAEAFTVSALANVADGELMPWDMQLASRVNYETDIPTLTDSIGRGVLDTQ